MMILMMMKQNLKCLQYIKVKIVNFNRTDVSKLLQINCHPINKKLDERRKSF